MTGEIEDTDVGFPGPEHHIAEHEFPMKLAMGGLAVLAIVGGFLQIPHVNEGLHQFLEPTFHDSALYEELEPSEKRRVGMVVGALLGAARHLHRLHAVGPLARAAAAIQARFAPLHTFFVNKWYFDEAIDFLVVRPMAWSAASPAPRSSACSSTARSSAGPPASCGSPPPPCAGYRPATCATTPLCC